MKNMNIQHELQNLANAMIALSEVVSKEHGKHYLQTLGEILGEHGYKLCECRLIYRSSEYADYCGDCYERGEQLAEARESAYQAWQREQH